MNSSEQEIMPEIKMVSLDKLHKNPNNPRIIKDDKFKKLCQSIKEDPWFMRLRPIIYDETGMILGGNMRYEACKFLEMKEAPAISANDLTEDQKNRFIIKDNVPGGEWDWDVLANEWDVSDLEAWGLDTIKQNYELDEPSFCETSEEKQSIKIVFFKKDLDVIKHELESLKNEYDGFNFYE